MTTNLLALLATSILCVTLGVAAVAVAAKRRMPVKFKNLDEQRTVYNVACWAAKQLDIKAGDRRLLYSRLLRGVSSRFNWMGSIPVQELAILSPFIDLMIEGKGPPLNQPAEYEDRRPAILKQFKERMQTEELWPQLAKANRHFIVAP